jgi:hypothetical protein
MLKTLGIPNKNRTWNGRINRGYQRTMAVLNVDKLTITYPKVDKGIELHFRGRLHNKLSLNISHHEYFLDFHGNYWSALPSGASSLANWVLPLRVTPIVAPSVAHNCYAFSLVLGDNAMTHEAFFGGLEKLVAGGDPSLLLEVRYRGGQVTETSLFCQAVTSASQILSATKPKLNPAKCILIPATPKILASIPRRSTGIYGLHTVRWVLFPLLFILFCWSILYYETEHPLLEYSPGLVTVLMNTTFTYNFRQAAPFHPATLTQAWELGYLKAQIDQLTNEATQFEIESLLRTAAEIVGRDPEINPVTLKAFSEAPTVLREIELSKGLITRLLGFFSFVNIIWMVAILGITISVGPTIYIALKPLRKYMMGTFKRLFFSVILPVIRVCHEWGVFEASAWCVTIGFMLDALRIQSPEVSFLISLTGIGLAIPCTVYSTVIHAGSIIKELSTQARDRLVTLDIFLALTPVAIYYQSSLCGFFVVAAIYHQIGFSFVCLGLTYVIGFHSRQALIRVAVSSSILLACYSAFKLFCDDPTFLIPFKLPVGIMGSLTLYLALLIFTSVHYYGSKESNYIVRQIPMIVALLLGLFAGNVVVPNSGLGNTATVFLILYGIEKGTDAHYISGASPWFLMFFISVSGYFAALWFHTHPDVIASILTL